MKSSEIVKAGSEPAGDTRKKLIDAGEQLYARSGIEGANLLAIARAAGQSNKSAVQYHFGDRAGLIQAILADRVAWLEDRRAELLTEAGPEPDAKTLIEIVLRPLAELVDADGKRTYARFLLQFMIQFEPWTGVRHPLRRPHEETALDTIYRRLKAAFPQLPTEILTLRMDWCLRTFLGMLVDHDNAIYRGRQPPLLTLLIDEAVELCHAALSASASRTGTSRRI